MKKRMNGIMMARKEAHPNRIGPVESGATAC
jgi:hypothetical protein